MSQVRSNSNLHDLPSLRFAWTSARKTHAYLMTALVLCAATLATTPAYGASSKPHADTATSDKDIHFGTIVEDGKAKVPGFNSDAAGFLPDLTLTYKKVRPGVTYELTNLVLYNSRCQEVTAGTWYLDSAPPAYGKVTQGYTYGRLSNGACAGIKFKSRAIYYTWTHNRNAKKDKFKSYWAGAGKKTSPITFDFDLDY